MKLSEAKKVIEIIKTSSAKIDMVDPILDMVDESPAIKLEAQKTEPIKKDKPVKEKQKRNYKSKPCEMCGEVFTPHYGAQRLCDKCKDIQDTAYDLAFDDCEE